MSLVCPSLLKDAFWFWWKLKCLNSQHFIRQDIGCYSETFNIELLIFKCPPSGHLCLPHFSIFLLKDLYTCRRSLAWVIHLWLGELIPHLHERLKTNPLQHSPGELHCGSSSIYLRHLLSNWCCSSTNNKQYDGSPHRTLTWSLWTNVGWNTTNGRLKSHKNWEARQLLE